MNCPSCDNRISIWAGNTTQCVKCGSRLKAVNGLAVNVVFFVVAALTFKLLIAGALNQESPVAFALIAAVVGLYCLVRWLFISYEVTSGES